MHIAIISYEYPPDTAFGGIGTYSHQVARMLSANGHSVEVFAASGKRDGFEENGTLRVNFIRELDRDLFATKVARAFGERHALRRFDVLESPEYGAEGRHILDAHADVAHVVKLHTPIELVHELNHSSLNVTGWLRQTSRRTRHIMRSLKRGQMPSPRRRRSAIQLAQRLSEQVEREYVKRCDFVVSPSKSLMDWSISRWDIDPTRLMVVPNPYVPSQELLHIHPREDNKVVVGFVGRIEHRKGILDLVDAIPLILREKPETQFRFVGEALSHPSTLESFDTFVLRKLRRYRDNIQVMGMCPLDQMPREYFLLDICVFPSIWENFPNVCLEAMSAGKPVVASRAGGMAEMLENGGGILVSPHSPSELATAVIQLIESRELRLSAGEMGRRQVLERYSTAALLPLIERSYTLAIEANRARRTCR